ncbi:MAG: FAD-dependent oxidoreductase [Nocardioidaceae bacterium]|nr:FAD-dependent oxidoreductase [Nocardioidaceae bacterium]
MGAHGPDRVLVVGGGAGGVIATAHLLERVASSADAEPVAVTIIERSPVVGPGLAYTTTHPQHLLNNYAGRMSALDHDPRHFVRWCGQAGLDVTGDTFVSRETYGRYLAGLLDAHPVPPGSRVSRLRDEVVEVRDTGRAYVARTARGASLAADVVVLALGNPPPRRPRGLVVDEERFVENPWDAGLLDRVPDRGSVLLVGTGLTTVDVAAQVAGARPEIRLTAASRHGLLPLRHLEEAPGPVAGLDADSRRLAGVLGEARRHLAGGEDFRCVVESVKAVGNDIWAGLSPRDRERFVNHVARYWEVARHRIAPPMARVVDDLTASGRLTVTTSRDVDPAAYDLVVNCTGPAPVSSTGWNPLVDQLAVTGMLWPGPFGLGVDVDTTGALVDEHGVAARGLYAVGAARRGVEWEVAAVPDIRRQARRLAEVLRPSYAAVPDPLGRLVG